MDTPRTVVVGLDGASFELIEPWLESGHLPNIARIVDDGVQGTLESVLPPVTSPNWKTYATGKNPGKLGIFWWENVDVTNRRVGYPDERKHAHATFWELLAEDDPVCVIGVPTTYPPTALNGAVVAGAPDGANEGYTHPPELETELEERFDYRVTKRYRLKDDVERAAEEIHELIERRFDAAEYLCAEYDPQFLQVTTFYLNSLHHYLWDHEYTLAAWQIVDDYLGTVLSDERDVVLMSDHGSNQIETVFNVNTWLDRKSVV